MAVRSKENGELIPAFFDSVERWKFISEPEQVINRIPIHELALDCVNLHFVTENWRHLSHINTGENLPERLLPQFMDDIFTDNNIAPNYELQDDLELVFFKVSFVIQ